MVSMLILRRTKKDAPRPFKVKNFVYIVDMFLSMLSGSTSSGSSCDSGVPVFVCGAASYRSKHKIFRCSRLRGCWFCFLLFYSIQRISAEVHGYVRIFRPPTIMFFAPLLDKFTYLVQVLFEVAAPDAPQTMKDEPCKDKLEKQS